MFKLRREHHTAAAPRQEQGQGPQVLNMCERPNWSALLVYYGNRSKLRFWLYVRSMSAAVCVRLHLIGSYTRDTWPNKAKTQLYDRPLHVQHKAANRNLWSLCVVVEASVREPQYVQSESVPHTKFVDS